MLDFENASIVCTACSKDDNTVLANTMPAWEAILWSSAQAAQASTATPHVLQNSLEPGEIGSVKLYGGVIAAATIVLLETQTHLKSCGIGEAVR